MSRNEANVLYKAFRETLVEYFQKTSLNGFGLLYYIRRRKYQRLFWFMFILMGISFATYVCLVTLINFLRNPTVTTLGSQNYLIWDVPFPAVAVCSVNKLSRVATEQYAREISSRSKREWPSSLWIQKMKLFAGYFESDAVDFDAAAKFQDELDILVQKPYNASEIIRKLAPPCTDLILKCSWAGNLKICNELFELHATPIGSCCIFNYQRGASDESKFPLHYPFNIGIEMGLTLLLNASTADHFVSKRSTSGFTVQVFSPNNFPDSSNGQVQEFFVSPGDDIEVQLHITTQVTTPGVHGYSAEKRHCYFTEDHLRTYGLAYSKAECLTRCKLNSVLALCGCIPYYTPIDFIDWNATVSYCTLAHVECLERNSLTWNTYHPMMETLTEELQQELQNSIDCSDCLPLCTYNHYQYKKLSGKLSKTKHLKWKSLMLQNMDNVENLSLVQLYFSTSYATQYRKSVIYNWYQILSNIGGVIGICMGCSFISGFEIIYFLGYRFFVKLLKLSKVGVNG